MAESDSVCSASMWRMFSSFEELRCCFCAFSVLLDVHVPSHAERAQVGTQPWPLPQFRQLPQGAPRQQGAMEGRRVKPLGNLLHIFTRSTRKAVRRINIRSWTVSRFFTLSLDCQYRVLTLVRVPPDVATPFFPWYVTSFSYALTSCSWSRGMEAHRRRAMQPRAGLQV